MGIRAQWE
uniref:Uncharacterized protein n=1 Tax=Arundo donax TaxID=35708 RepID=A0A0A8ZJS2_ARUDO